MKRKAMEIDKHKIERREGRGGGGHYSSPHSGMVRPSLSVCSAIDQQQSNDDFKLLGK